MNDEELGYRLTREAFHNIDDRIEIENVLVDSDKTLVYFNFEEKLGVNPNPVYLPFIVFIKNNNGYAYNIMLDMDALREGKNGYTLSDINELYFWYFQNSEDGEVIDDNPYDYERDYKEALKFGKDEYQSTKTFLLEEFQFEIDKRKFVEIISAYLNGGTIRSSFREGVRAGCGKWKHIKEYYDKKKKGKKKVKSRRMALSSVRISDAYQNENTLYLNDQDHYFITRKARESTNDWWENVDGPTIYIESCHDMDYGGHSYHYAVSFNNEHIVNIPTEKLVNEKFKWLICFPTLHRDISFNGTFEDVARECTRLDKFWFKLD